MALKHPGSHQNDPHHSADDEQKLYVLVVEDAEGRRPIALDAVTFSLGRDPGSAIVLHGTSISRQQAILLRTPNPDGGYIYQLLDGNSVGRASRNGTFVNGKPCRRSQPLQDGDELLFGKDVKARYYVRSPRDGELGHYLESVGYRSVKAAVSDPKATTMQRINDLEMTQVGPLVSSTVVIQPEPPPARPAQRQSQPKRHAPSKQKQHKKKQQNQKPHQPKRQPKRSNKKMSPNRPSLLAIWRRWLSQIWPR
ncbi:MAG: FHA domain-containing protein [Synechococcaceae cyanobacterium SM2_3_2]|nr:FHA domain-containing protein [Synechococcaceae cyanobacterium SM2_3_2]